MKVLSYNYIINEDLGANSYMTSSYIDRMREYIQTVRLDGKCAFLYVGGATVSSSEMRNTEADEVLNSTLCIKELSAYSMHKWIGVLDGREHIQYANINANTCASSMHSIYEAEQLLNNGYDQVVIVAEERTSYNTKRIFREHNIDIQIGQGCAIVHLGKASTPAEEEITNCKWFYEYTRNPFATTSRGYQSVYSDCDVVKPHGTGTQNNEEAEQPVIEDKLQYRYKEKIGHTQGASGLIEICMILDEAIAADILCMSAGLGGFYGSCIVHKR